ncbi:PQQ-dependent sugar dehydrogenase [Paraglaciecola aquimarina]|uniref:PQQ-dependent sugar dehydrogenase n=1 Tax=Paraglaciecola algarum TaxID=3050085 RepID=A0ABS9DB32_9ALTE|nr:PQQ-dependent sugar dehydrogenase [Paraglaciecola sp. G1-23]MCF2950061.1 PQQ-dependent sugar dehydrogenase [Paraglaciecola sp. G1-23]
MKKFIILVLLVCLPVFVYSFQLKEVVSELEQPTDLLFLSEQQLLVAEKTGRLVLVDLTKKSQKDVHNFEVLTDSELGLLGITLHPNFQQNQFIFVNYNPKEGERRTRISRFTLNNLQGAPSLSNEKVILEVEQPYKNHDAGQIAFGPDGFLYIGMGDGGSGGDPKGHGQNLKTLLGTVLRVDIDAADNIPYLIPATNPFINNSEAKDEIWAYGIRNPWRFTFHEETLILADVGQNKLEEVNVITKGKNYGWKVMEGNECFKDKKQSCDKSQYEAPKITYGRDQGQSITGGKVYTKGHIKSLASRYIYADFITGKIWSAKYPEFTDNKLEIDTDINVSAFGLDIQGELYLADYANGKIHQIVE